MSKITTEKCKCPFCGQEIEFDAYKSANVSLDPELKERIIDGSIFKITCKHCKNTFTIYYNMLFHDMKDKVMIQFAPTGYNEIKQSIMDMIERYPGMRNNTSRIVKDYRHFVEKILIFEAKLNDVAMELAKVIMKYDKENSLSSESEIFFYKITDARDKIIFVIPSKDGGKPKFVILSYDDYMKHVDAVIEDDRFNTSYQIENICEEWIEKRLS